MCVHLVGTTAEGLAKPPIRRGRIVRYHLPAVAGIYSEGEGKANYVPGAPFVCPNLAPVARHLEPPCRRALDEHLLNVAGACYVVDEYHHVVGVPVDGEAHPSFLVTMHPELQEKHYSLQCYDRFILRLQSPRKTR